MPDKPYNETPPPDEAAEQARPRGLGETLRAVREAEHLSIERVAAELRIEPRFLVALEEERFEAVGAPVFAKGYLKLYAECLGLDTASVLRLYEEKAGNVAPPFEGRRSVERRDSPQGAAWMLVALLAVAVVVVLLGIWFLHRPAPAIVSAAAFTAPAATAPGAVEAGSGQSAGEAQNPVSALEEAVSRHDQASAEPVEVPAPPAKPAASSPAAPGPGAAQAGAGATGAQAASVAPEPAAEPPGAAGSSTAADAKAKRSTAAPGANGPASGDSLEMDLQFLQDSWVEVTDARRQRLFYGLGKAGDLSRVNGEPPFDVLLGNADGVVVEVGGHPFTYPRRAHNGKVAHFTVTGPAD